MLLLVVFLFCTVSADNFLRIDPKRQTPANRERTIRSPLCTKRCRNTICRKAVVEDKRYHDDSCIECYSACLEEHGSRLDKCNGDERYPVRWFKIRHVVYTGNGTYAVDADVVTAPAVTAINHSIAIEYRFANIDWRPLGVNAVNAGHNFRIFGLQKGWKYQFRVWCVWNGEMLCGMPFISKWIEAEASLLASVSAGSFFHNVRFAVSPTGELTSSWNVIHTTDFMTIDKHLLYYEVTCRAISGHHSSLCDFDQIHFYLNKNSNGASFMLPPIRGPCLYQIQLSAVFHNSPTKIFSKTIQYAQTSPDDRP